MNFRNISCAQTMNIGASHNPGSTKKHLQHTNRKESFTSNVYYNTVYVLGAHKHVHVYDAFNDTI